MKRIICIILMVLAAPQLFAQVMNGVVRDRYNHQPLPSAIISYSNLTIITDANGNFSLPALRKDSLHVVCRGYISRDLLITDSSNVVVLLEPDNNERNFIQTEAFKTKSSILSAPGSVEVLTAADLHRTNGVKLEDAFNVLPGVKIEKRADNGAIRIVMRGYGNQSNTGSTGYKAYYNDIPLTEADGTTFLDDMDPVTIGKVEINKGPVSATEGAGIGGLLLMHSEKAPDGITIHQSYETGSYGLMRTNTSLGVGTNESNLQINYGRQLSNGYRMHTLSRNDFITLTGDFYSSPKRTFSVFVSYTKHFALLAGQLSRKQFEATPDTAELALLQNDANIDIESYRTGITQYYKFNDRFTNKTSLFFAGQSIDQPGNAILNKSNRTRFGAKTSFDFTQPLGNTTAVFSFGGEINKNINYLKTYNYVATVLGTVRADMEVKPATYNAFTQIKLILPEGTTITAGGSLNYTEYDIVDERAASGYVNVSGYKRFRPLFMPEVSFTHFLDKNKSMSLYTSYRTGYAPPSTTQVVITQTGVVNNNLNPETAESFEVGTKGTLLRNRLNYRLAFFNMDVKDKFITQNFAAASGVPAYSVTTNAGTVNGKGIELFLQYAYVPVNSVVSVLRPFFSYTFNDYRNTELRSDNNNNSATKNYSGMAVSGLAKNLFSAGLDVETVNGFYCNLTDLYTGKMPIVLDNSEYADSYNLLNGRLGWRKNISSKKGANRWMIDIFVGADNLTNQLYSPLISINQAYVGTTPTVAGSSQALFFNPAAPKATWYTGCSLRLVL